MPLIEVHDLSVRYPRAPEYALHGINFQIEQGEVVLLLGPSGSGKSTIGLCLAGLIPEAVPAHVEGRVIVAGAEAPEERRRQVGVVFQDPEAQFCMLTVEDEVAFGLENIGLPPEQMEGRITEALALVGMAECRREQINHLSGGQKQRLALACALAMRPPILFLDEPTANLDPAARYEFFQTLRRLRWKQPGLTMIIVEHILDDLISMVDRVLLLGAGGVTVGSGAPALVFEEQGDRLDQMGIWLPQVTALARKLRLAGLPISRLPLTVEEADRELSCRLATRRLPAPAVSGLCGASSGEAGELAFAVDGLSFAYSSRRPVLHEVSLRVPSGAFMALVGPNGAGKTTLVAHLAGILRPPAGVVRLFGDDICHLSVAQITERTGFVFQNPEHQFVEQRVDAELAYSLRVRRRPADEIGRVVESLLDSFGLAPYRGRSPFALSQGQKRRLSVATMLAVGQRALILDEPTFGQDRHTAHALMAQLCRLNQQGVTILAVTHDMQMVADYAGAAVVLVDGRLRFAGPTPRLFADEALLEQAALRPLPLHELARAADVSYDDGTLPMSIREWLPFFGVDREGAVQERERDEQPVHVLR